MNSHDAPIGLFLSTLRTLRTPSIFARNSRFAARPRTASSIAYAKSWANRNFVTHNAFAKMTELPKDTLHFPDSDRAFLEPHVPPKEKIPEPSGIFTTLTFATSLDSSLALSPGAPTALSGPQSKAMTHFLRSRHDAILVGVGTAVADDPGLNCRLEGVGGYGGKGLEGQPRPIIVDPAARWNFTEHSKLFKLTLNGRSKAPYILTGLDEPPVEKKAVLDKCGGKYIKVKIAGSSDMSVAAIKDHRFDWHDVLNVLVQEGLTSVMIEGGAGVINDLLLPRSHRLINSIIVTLAPTWLGQGGVVVSPPRRFNEQDKPVPAARLTAVEWHPFGEDVVLCGKLKL